MWAPYTIWQAVLKGQVILRQKAYFGPDYYGRHFLIWCASFNRKISFSSLNFREGEAILPKCLSKGIVAQVSDNTSNISTLPAQHSWIWAKNKIPFNQVFPLHHTPSLESLQKSWVRKIFGLQPLGEKRKFCVTSFFLYHMTVQVRYLSILVSRSLSTLLGLVTTPLPWASLLSLVEASGWVSSSILYQIIFCKSSSFSSTGALSSWKISALFSFHFSMSFGPLSISRCHSKLSPINHLFKILGLEASLCRAFTPMGLPRVQVSLLHIIMDGILVIWVKPSPKKTYFPLKAGF